MYLVVEYTFSGGYAKNPKLRYIFCSFTSADTRNRVQQFDHGCKRLTVLEHFVIKACNGLLKIVELA
jgi:hypothetical protein